MTLEAFCVQTFPTLCFGFSVEKYASFPCFIRCVRIFRNIKHLFTYLFQPFKFIGKFIFGPVIRCAPWVRLWTTPFCITWKHTMCNNNRLMRRWLHPQQGGSHKNQWRSQACPLCRRVHFLKVSHFTENRGGRYEKYKVYIWPTTEILHIP